MNLNIEVKNVIVVTQKYHLYRGDRYRKFRESLARIKDIGYVLAKPEPTYLGDVIPVSGDGDVTNDKKLGFTLYSTNFLKLSSDCPLDMRTRGSKSGSSPGLARPYSVVTAHLNPASFTASTQLSL